MAASEPNELDLLTRFVCLGSETGSINVLSKREFSPDDASSVHAIISHNRGPDAVKRLKSISQQKCYVKKDCMLYALARIIREATPQSQGNHKGDSLRKEAYTLVQELCDSSSNLFKFIHYDKQVASPPKASWGRGVRKLITKWYNSRSSLDLAREATACKSAHGWSHKDLLCQVHFNSKSKSSGKYNETSPNCHFALHLYIYYKFIISYILYIFSITFSSSFFSPFFFLKKIKFFLSCVSFCILKAMLLSLDTCLKVKWKRLKVNRLRRKRIKPTKKL